MNRLFIVVHTFFATIGLVATSMAVGLYASGFFHWAAKRAPELSFLQFFFGAST